MLIILVIACVWYSRQQFAKTKDGQPLKLIDPPLYTALIAFALVLAVLWR
jgi:hypothetical protein